jgi:hypothetical protein
MTAGKHPAVLSTRVGGVGSLRQPLEDDRDDHDDGRGSENVDRILDAGQRSFRLPYLPGRLPQTATSYHDLCPPVLARPPRWVIELEPK